MCNIHYWHREFIRSTFYDDLEQYITTKLKRFNPIDDPSLISTYSISVDWSLNHNEHQFYLFGVRGNDKAKNVAIALLEFGKEGLLFISMVIHENMEELGRKERLYLTKNADNQYPMLLDFQEKSPGDINRLANIDSHELT